MRRRLLELIGVATAIAAVTVILQLTAASVRGQAPSTTAWGHPDLEGIWLDVYSTPLQRAPGIGEREFATEEERAARDQAALARPPILPSGAYNTVYTSARPAGPADVARGRPAGRADSRPHAGGGAAERDRAGVARHAPAEHRDLPERCAAMRRGRVRARVRRAGTTPRPTTTRGAA